MIVRFFQWDHPKNIFCALKDITRGDQLVVEHEWGVYLAEVVDANKSLEGEEPVGQALRKATAQDREILLNNQIKQEELLKDIKIEARDAMLPMKIIDVQTSLDGGALVVAFLADGRVDFRTLVKKLSTRFQKTVRFQQIGSRDEARRCGGYGVCGREICCRKFPGSLKSISTEMARDQLISHRGSDRISGLCGRLMCCLSFEADQYQEMMKGLPERGREVRLRNNKGQARVVDLCVLKQCVKVQTEDGKIIQVSKDDIES